MPRPLAIVPLLLLPLVAPVHAEDQPAKPKINFAEHVAPIFQARCNSCHNGDKQKGGLSLESFGSTMRGGGSGAVVEPGDADGSHLLGVVNQSEEPKMPPAGSKIPDAEIAILRQWIEAGAPETSGSAVMVKAKPKFEFKLDPNALGKPVGPPAMPEDVAVEPVVVGGRATAVVALATSPWAPLVAVGGHKQVLLYQSGSHRLVGVFPFPEGTIHVLKFSRNGSLLLAGGGRGGQSGLAVVYDVKTGKRVFEVGKEYDVVLAADISPDHGQVALGGPSKVVRVYGTADGQLQFEMKKHTEWITTLEFSPDGVLLASGDRNNGLFVWEGQTGREFFELRGHAAAISDVSWRPDSNVLASASEDGSIRLWEMENGTQIKTWGAHGGGSASVRFARDGRLVTTGRDRLVRVWDQNGGKQRELEPTPDLALRASFVDEDAKIVVGDWSGEVRVVDARDGRKLGLLDANPAPIAVRLDRTRQIAQAAKAESDAAAAGLPPLRTALDAATAKRDQANQALNAAKAEVARLAAEATAADQGVNQAKAAEASVQKTLSDARAAVEQATAAEAEAQKAIAATEAAEKAANEALAAAKTTLEKAGNDKVAYDPTLASAVESFKTAADPGSVDRALVTLEGATARSAELATAIARAGKAQAVAFAAAKQATTAKEQSPARLAAATERVRVAIEAVKPAEAAATTAAQVTSDRSGQLAKLRTGVAAAEAAVPARTAEVTAAEAARVAAEKILADRTAAAAALAARATTQVEEIAFLEARVAKPAAAPTPVPAAAPVANPAP